MESSGVRVSDQERDQAAQQLREHFAAGRLTQDELNERVEGAYQARTRQQLDQLLTDLPALPATTAQLKAELVERRHHLQRRLLQEADAAAAPFLICTIIWAASGAQGGFWPAFVAIPLILLLARNGWRLYGPSPEGSCGARARAAQTTCRPPPPRRPSTLRLSSSPPSSSDCFSSA